VIAEVTVKHNIVGSLSTVVR